MATTAIDLIRELGYRTSDIILARATSNGSTTTIVDTGLRRFLPVDGRSDHWTPWVYAISSKGPAVVPYVFETQTVRVFNATSGSFQLSLDGVEWTSSIAYNAAAAAIETALEALSTIGTGNVTVTGSGNVSTTVQNIAFVGAMAQIDVPWLQAKWSFGDSDETAYVYTNTTATGSAKNTSLYSYEQRAQSWAASSTTITLYSPGFPVATQNGDTFELHFTTRRPRKLSALNSAVRQLGLYWYRHFKDESLTTADKTWTYTPPASAYWKRVYKVEVQVSTDATLVGYPYEDASRYGWKAYKTTTTAGVESWTLQFSTVPPADRTIRVWGEGYFPDLDDDADVLMLDGDWKGRALEWIYAWAKHQLFEEIRDKVPATESQKYQGASYSSLQKALMQLKSTIPERPPGRVLVPTVAKARDSDISWLAANETPTTTVDTRVGS